MNKFTEEYQVKRTASYGTSNTSKSRNERGLDNASLALFVQDNPISLRAVVGTKSSAVQKDLEYKSWYDSRL